MQAIPAKKILILGSEGFIGSHLVQFFSKLGIQVFGGDLFETSSVSGYNYFKISRLSPEWEDVLRNYSFDVCINAAGSGNVSYSMSHPLQDFEANTLDVIRILDAIRKFNHRCRYVNISSAAVYGNVTQLPITEESPIRPLSAYGWHKWMSEQICREYQHVYGISTVILRPFSVYGNGLRKQLLWDIYQKVSSSSDVKLFGTGKESRDFIHVGDLCALIDIIIRNAPFQAEVYNAGSGQETQVSTIAAYFSAYFSEEVRITFSGEQRPGDPLNWQADISKAKALGFVPSVSVQQGIADYVAWAKEVPLNK